jgi:hypothetical protein
MEISIGVRKAAREILGNVFDVYDPGDNTSPGTVHTAEEVYLIDHSRTIGADLVFFHVRSPSLGVGIESQIAADATIPRVVARPEGAAVSRMFSGVFSPTVAEIEYADIEAFRAKLIQALPDIVEKARASRTIRAPMKRVILAGMLGRGVMKSRILKQMPIRRLAELCDIREHFLSELERKDEVAACLTNMQALRLAHALDATVFLSKSSSSFEPPTVLDEAQKDSLDYLVAWVIKREDEDTRPIPDAHLLALWSDFAGTQGSQQVRPPLSTIAARHAKIVRKRTIADWERAYTEKFGLGLSG